MKPRYRSYDFSHIGSALNVCVEGLVSVAIFANVEYDPTGDNAD